MTATASTPTASTPSDDSVPATASRLAAAGIFLEGLGARDFDRLASTLAPDVNMHALLPRGAFDWDGAGEVQATFTGWFGDLERFEVMDAAVDEIGARLHLHWRLRTQSARRGSGWFIVEQQAYADMDDTDRITHLSLLCTGFVPEQADA